MCSSILSSWCAVVVRKIAPVSSTILSEVHWIWVVLVTESPHDQSMAPRSPRLPRHFSQLTT
ncbi:hypothetical protein E4T44_08333 [Aureobasidium sp. EXF-8845]|nr:hypothetical protein E4T44_08333 [Aureobasidium sp. EXF-8845]